MPVLEEAMTSSSYCSAKNTQKWEKIIAKNKGAFSKPVPGPLVQYPELPS